MNQTEIDTFKLDRPLLDLLCDAVRERLDTNEIIRRFEEYIRKIKKGEL